MLNGKEIFLYFVCDLYNFKNIYLLILWFKIFKLKKIKRIIWFKEWKLLVLLK